MTIHRGGVLGNRLFERLATPERPEASGAEASLAEIVESIKRHLVDLLNSHPGHSECAPELGLLDFNDATIGVLDLERNIQRAIRQCIERFEPRVRQVEVESLPRGSDPLQLRFQVHATVDLGRDQGQATIDLLLNDKRYQCLN
ncbi:type VI secretion system baseplate subunit TssE [Halomonas daqingensis]|uniref:Type VI secretion system baseplate subunit TssE n=1 Tax=Billgrantia desiderata TaxID=52021 RepID=A0AAW4YUM7_9GAMM|nr:type VI secretion system baseplate subunit TssE [Halomonas desiderata]MCE8010361.1 type VI secretion system baseplate subunit TssE [Halomonas desiderata]MCE8030563.1 type VI secretion system baseplate subunit TssE [Halomonas desiderata]MCE8043670.1 type VI secretion system baseplate subunit TssE [Halomonas desiderata]MCE8048244.1 type VI secretion system baseplate subunit TssE [Halomonas desiderata]MCE8052221.1 type VI secretion system baseplate subunit TssE [Halomonas desiderata]